MNSTLPPECRTERAVLDGEIVCLDRKGDSQFKNSQFRLACKRDPEGIVAMRKFDPYLLDNAKGWKIRNRDYSRWVGREEYSSVNARLIPTSTVRNVCAGASDPLVEAHPE